MAETNDDRLEGRLAWLYLGVIFALFGGFALWAFAQTDGEVQTATPRTTTTLDTTTVVASAAPVDLELAIDGTQVTLIGVVPDEATRTTLMGLANARYASGTVVDQMTVGDVALAGGQVRVTGSTEVGDAEPEGLQADIAAVLGLVAGDVALEREQVFVPPADTRISLDRDAISFVGEVPDQAAFDALVQPAIDLWGDGRVDSSELRIGLTTLEGAVVTVDGTIDAGDVRVQNYEAALAQNFPGLTVDRATLVIDTGADALGRLEQRLRELVAANPILFELGSAEISPESDATLQLVAQAISATPGIKVQVVGHTDDQGPESINQTLSEDRAGQVQSRLITLGVPIDQFLLPRGAGESEPIADNSTEEGQAQNRRIAFEFEGAADVVADGDDG